MNDDDYVSYEIAQALKTAGFDWPTQAYFAIELDGKQDLWVSGLGVVRIFDLKGRDTLAPSLCQAQKWLRERGLCVSVYPSPFSEDINGEYAYKVYQYMDYEEWNDPCAEYAKDYNSALSAGIEAALKLIENPTPNPKQN